MKADEIEPGYRSHAALIVWVTVRVENRQIDPAEVKAKTRAIPASAEAFIE